MWLSERASWWAVEAREKKGAGETLAIQTRHVVRRARHGRESMQLRFESWPTRNRGIDIDVHTHTTHTRKGPVGETPQSSVWRR